MGSIRCTIRVTISQFYNNTFFKKISKQKAPKGAFLLKVAFHIVFIYDSDIVN